MKVRKFLRVIMVLGFLPALMAAGCPELCTEFPEFCDLEEEAQVEQEAAPAVTEEPAGIEVAVVQD